MVDREKVIEVLEKAKTVIENWVPMFEQYNTPVGIDYAIALLKEQETKWIHREDLDFKDKLGCHHFHGMCGNCGFIHDFLDDHTGQYKYCPECGRAVKWDG